MVDDKTREPRGISADALKAFAHPLRMAMYSALTNDGPATATMLGRALGESSGQTSYHLRQLERHGFVEDDPAHTGGRERWWRAVGFSLDDADLLQDPDTASSARVVLRSVVADRARTMSAWLDHLDDDWQAQVATSSSILLTQDETADLITRTRAVIEEFEVLAREREPGDGPYRRIRVYLDAFPLAPAPPA